MLLKKNPFNISGSSDKVDENRSLIDDDTKFDKVNKGFATNSTGERPKRNPSSKDFGLLKTVPV